MSHQILISILQKFTRQSRLTTLNEYLIKYRTLMYIFGSFMNEYLSKFLPHHLPLPSLPLITTPPPPPKHFVRIQINNHVLTPPPSSRSKLCPSPQRLLHLSSPTHHPWVFKLYLSYPSPMGGYISLLPPIITRGWKGRRKFATSEFGTRQTCKNFSFPQF